MVSISPATDSVNRDEILHASDVAIRDLLNDPIDPMALATYLWVYIRRKPAITNGDQLVRWGMAWTRRIFLEGKISQRRDEDMSSAALAIAALINSPSFQEIKGEVKRKLEQAIAAELERAPVPFRQPSYAAMFLLAAYTIGISNPKIAESALAIHRIYSEGVFTGRSFGFSFLVILTKVITSKDSIKELAKGIELALADPATSYEDRAYLLQALWELNDDDKSARLLEHTEAVLSRVPAWVCHPVQCSSYIMEGRESDLESASHLYRASLLDITALYNERRVLYAEERFNERYSGRRAISLMAFSSVVLLLSLLLGLLGLYVYRGGQEARRFWLFGEYGAMSSSSALSYLAAVLLASYILSIAPIVLWKTFSLLVVSNIQSDQKLKDVLKPPLSKVSLAWFTLILLGIVVGLITGVLTQGFQHILK